jgi:hypothetical protein
LEVEVVAVLLQMVIVRVVLLAAEVELVEEMVV